VPTRKEIKAATTGDPEALPRIALVGAWTDMKMPAITASARGMDAAFIVAPMTDLAVEVE
jgi:hypothetical protein